MLRTTILLSIIIFCIACNNSEDPFANCKYKKPTAIFTDKTPEISTQSFKADKTSTTETVYFGKREINLELIQSGCDQLRQEFRFTQKGNFEKTQDGFWIAAAQQMFHFLGSLGEKFAAYEMFAQAIGQNAARFKLSEPLDLGMNQFLTIDRILSPEKAQLIVTLQEGK